MVYATNPFATSLRGQLQVSAALFLLAALYHLAAIAAPSLGIRGAQWRHVRFAGIDVTFAWLFLRRPWRLAFPWRCSRGIGCALTDTERGRSGSGQGADWIGIGAIAVLPIILAVVVADGWQQRKRVG
jgi:hypothetical protein